MKEEQEFSTILVSWGLVWATETLFEKKKLTNENIELEKGGKEESKNTISKDMI